MARWELRVLQVVERRVQPVGCVMAGLARGREELRLGRVAWIGGVVIVGLMAPDTSRWQCCVIAVDMAIGALPRRGSMRTGQGEGCIVVIKG